MRGHENKWGIMKGAISATAMGLALTIHTLPAHGGEPPDPLVAIESRTAPKEYTDGAFDRLRPSAITEAARTLAVQAGVKWRYGQILDSIRAQESQVDVMFDFRQLLIHDGKVLPPVIVEGRDAYRLEAEQESSTVGGCDFIARFLPRDSSYELITHFRHCLKCVIVAIF